MTRNVLLTERAERDVRGILSWLSEHSAQGARAWSRRWDEVLEFLRDNAGHCILAPESSDETEIRHHIFKTRRGRPYRVLFVIMNADVFVIHVRSPGQDVVPQHDMQLPD